MTTLGQRWQTVVPLADGWRWVHNVGPTLGQRHRVLDENWKSVPFILMALQFRAVLWANIENCADHKSLLNNIGQDLLSKQRFISLDEHHRANVGPTSRFAKIKRILIVYFINIGPTLIFTYMYAYIFHQMQQTQ